MFINTFEKAARQRGNLWECRSCGAHVPASELVWNGAAVPTCPHCFVQDMLFERRLPPPPPEMVAWF